MKHLSIKEKDRQLRVKIIFDFKCQSKKQGKTRDIPSQQLC